MGLDVVGKHFEFGQFDFQQLWIAGDLWELWIHIYNDKERSNITCISSESSTYRLQLIQSGVRLVDPDQQFVECVLELTEMEQRVFQLLLAFDHAA